MPRSTKKCLKPCNSQGFKTLRAPSPSGFSKHQSMWYIIYLLNIYMEKNVIKIYWNYIQTLQLQWFRTPKLLKLDDSEITVPGIVTKFHWPTLDQWWFIRIRSTYTTYLWKDLLFCWVPDMLKFRVVLQQHLASIDPLSMNSMHQRLANGRPCVASKKVDVSHDLPRNCPTLRVLHINSSFPAKLRKQFLDKSVSQHFG